MDYGDTICGQCADRVFHAEFRNPRRWRWITSQIGQSELVAARRRAAEETARSEATAARERAAEREASARHVVYYLRTAPNRLKIGTTRDLPRRLSEFRTDGSYLLAVEPGGWDLEQQRHAELRRWRVHRRREDYAEGPEVSARIKAVLAEHGDPTAFLRSAEKEAM